MTGESRKWMVLVATTWIQAFTGTNLDFSSYSTDLKYVLRMSQVQLNYVSVASDVGKAFGWCSGVLLLYFPTWVVVLVAAFMGLVGYGLQWLLIQQIISLPYFLVLLSSMLAGTSISWFNTVCYVLCIKNFQTNRALALSLSISFNGVSASIYTLMANSINPNDTKLYLLLNSVVPLITSVFALRQIIPHSHSEAISSDPDRSNLLSLTLLSVVTGLYLLFLSSISASVFINRLILSGAVFLLLLPLLSLAENDGFENEIHEELMGIDTNSSSDSSDSNENSVFADRLVVLGEEHLTRLLVRKWDFWLYYVVYLCGGTLGLVYSNNLGQICESLGYHSDISSLVSMYSACSFFGRLLSATPDLLQGKMFFARTGWLMLALVPTPIAFLMLASSGTKGTLYTSTALVGLSSGFVFSAAVSVTAELFGPKRAGVNHNILITNIPLGSLLYSLLAGMVYEDNIGSSRDVVLRDGSRVCIGRDCFYGTFVWWWWISLLGFVCGLVLFVRTKGVYDRMEKGKFRNQVTLLKSLSLSSRGK